MIRDQLPGKFHRIILPRSARNAAKAPIAAARFLILRTRRRQWNPPRAGGSRPRGCTGVWGTSARTRSQTPPVRAGPGAADEACDPKDKRHEGRILCRDLDGCPAKLPIYKPGGLTYPFGRRRSDLSRGGAGRISGTPPIRRNLPFLALRKLRQTPNSGESRFHGQKNESRHRRRSPVVSRGAQSDARRRRPATAWRRFAWCRVCDRSCCCWISPCRA